MIQADHGLKGQQKEVAQYLESESISKILQRADHLPWQQKCLLGCLHSTVENLDLIFSLALNPSFLPVQTQRGNSHGSRDTIPMIWSAWKARLNFSQPQPLGVGNDTTEVDGSPLYLHLNLPLNFFLIFKTCGKKVLDIYFGAKINESMYSVFPKQIFHELLGELPVWPAPTPMSLSIWPAGTGPRTHSTSSCVWGGTLVLEPGSETQLSLTACPFS